MRLHAWKRLAHGGFLSVLVAATTALTSCGNSGRLPVYPIRGKVLVDGQPAKNAFVTFSPKGDSATGMPCPAAQTDENGEFALATYMSGDGAPAGEYDVTITWPVRYNPISTNWEGDRLSGRYNNPDKPPFRVTVEKKPQELPHFELKKSGPDR